MCARRSSPHRFGKGDPFSGGLTATPASNTDPTCNQWRQADGGLLTMRQTIKATKFIGWAFLCSFGFLIGSVAWSQEAETESQEAEAEEIQEELIPPLDEDGNLVRFERDIAPILSEHCLECHGPDDAKNDFRVDDSELMLDYLEPGDFESSMLYVDYLTIDDPDMLMPPQSHGGPLSAGQLALFRVWIQEGANWPEGVAISGAAEAQAAAVPPAPAPRTLPERVWVAQGFLHPATVHFPVALFMLGAGFVVLGWKFPSVGMQIPIACLLIGAASSVASTLMGWSFAPQQGYGSGWNILDWGREIDVHRWSGLIVTVFSSIVAIVALIALWKDSERLAKYWKVGLLVCAGMVSAVGHQGGELSYGADFYPKAVRILLGENQQAAPPVEEVPPVETVETVD
jgi:uncharacterized membrane protein